jgi:hypothetical protein
MRNRILFLLFFIGSSGILRGQTFPGTIILRNADTLHGKFHVFIRNKNTLDESSVSTRIKATLEDGQKVKLGPVEVKSFCIPGLKGGNPGFESLDQNLKFFFKPIEKGRISLYEYFPYAHTRVFVIITQEGKLENIEMLYWKKPFIKAMSDSQETIEKLNSGMYKYADLQKLVADYNNAFK